MKVFILQGLGRWTLSLRIKITIHLRAFRGVSFRFGECDGGSVRVRPAVMQKDGLLKRTLQRSQTLHNALYASIWPISTRRQILVAADDLGGSGLRNQRRKAQVNGAR